MESAKKKLNYKLKISVVIPTKDRAKKLADFLNSLDNQIVLPTELIVVDASSDDLSEKLISAKRENATYKMKYTRAAPGAARQRNIGFEMSCGDFIFFFDDDVVLDRKYIKKAIDAFLHPNDSPIGGVTGKIVNAEITPKFLDRIVRKLFFLSDSGKGIIKPSGFPSLKLGDKESYVQFLSGCNMAFPRAVLSEFRFDESLGGYSYMEDVDLSYRIAQKHLLFYQPEAKLYHFPSAYKKYDSKSLRKKMVQNHRYIFQKNFPRSYPYILAHFISLGGILIYNLLLSRDLKAFSGIVAGLFEPIRNAENN